MIGAISDRRGHAAVATLLLAAAAAASLVAGRAAAPPLRQAVVATATGEMRHVRLPDRSVMTLDAQSVAVIDAPGDRHRRLRIDRGRALFAVARDAARPFVVTAGSVTITALGTRFAVESEPGALVVALVEGSVRVDLSGGSRTLAPGEVLTLVDDAVTVRAGAAAIGTEWHRGTLTFDSVPLSTVVARMNRYSRQRIVIADAALGRRPFSGVLHTRGGTGALVGALAAFHTAHVVERTRDHITLASF